MLKKEDLASTETYKKAIRKDVTKVNPAGKTKFWVYKDVMLPNKEGKQTKLPAFVALIDDKQVKALLKKYRLLCKGMVALEGTKLDFKPIKGKVPYKTLKSAAPVYMGKMLHIPANVDEDADDDTAAIEDDEDEDEDESPETSSSEETESSESTAPVSGQEAQTAWGNLVKEVQQAAAQYPNRKDELSQAMNGVQDMLKASQFGPAVKRMEQISGQIKKFASGPQPIPQDLASAWQALTNEVKQEAARHPEKRDALQQAATEVQNLLRSGQPDQARQAMDKVREILGQATAQAGSHDLAQKWNALIKEMQEFAVKHPLLKDQLQKAAAGIPDLVKTGNTQEAERRMDIITQQMKQVKTTSDDNLQQATNDWKQLVSEMQEAIKTQPGLRDGLQKAGNGVAEMLKAGNGGEALKRMQGIREMLKAGGQQEQAFQQRFGPIEQRVNDRVKERPGNAGQLSAAIGLASERAAAGDYAGAYRVLDQIEVLLAQETPEAGRETGEAYEGLAKYRAALVEFRQARATVAGQIAGLRNAITSELENQEDLADALSEDLEDLNDEIDDAVDEALAVSHNDESPLNDAVKKSIAKYIDELSSNPLVKHADSSPFASVSIQSTLTAALKKIEAAFPKKVMTAEANS